jgi:uncharacterized SAM-binding protein YcdF (DUF218 family)
VTDTGAKPAERRATRPSGWTKLALAVPGALALAFFGGFAAFVANVSGRPVPADPHADAIVVMTGDSARIDGGLRLLAEGRAGRLLISGVHPSVDQRTLARVMAPERQALLGCCIDLDHDARDTVGNAYFTGRWAEQRGYHSLIVVTSDYHMPRTLAELSRTMPAAELVPYPVSDGAPVVGEMLTRPRAMRLLLSEYVKYIGARLRLMVAPSGAALAGTAPAEAGAR